jgi:hypothetical protein
VIIQVHLIFPFESEILPQQFLIAVKPTLKIESFSLPVRISIYRRVRPNRLSVRTLMPTYICDILVEDAQLYESMSSFRTPLWITLRADGVQVTFDTPHVPASPHPCWNTPVRFVLNLPNLEDRHFKATLRTTGYLGEVLSIACSQVRLTMLPRGHPRKFSFPLQNTRDFSVQAATLSITAAISELPPTPARQGYTQTPNYGSPVGPPWNGYPGTVPFTGRR